jgi:hypothetical protein
MSFLRAMACSILDEIEFTGRIKAACIEFIDRLDPLPSPDARVEDHSVLIVQLLAPGADISELFSNTLHELQVYQRRQQMEPDTLLALLGPFLRAIMVFLGMEYASPAQSIGAILMRM